MTNTGRGVLEGAFALLSALEEAGEARLTALASRSGLPKSSAHRLLDQLVALGAVERSWGAYRIGPRIFRLGRAWQPYPGLQAASAGTVRWLAETTGATVAICVLHEGRTMAAAGLPGEVAELAPMRPGETWPAMTAAGKVLLANAPAGLPLDPLPGSWRRTAQEIRERGAAFDREELVPGVACVAVPLHGQRGELIASLVSMVPAGRKLETLAETLTLASRVIEDGLRRVPRQAARPLTRGASLPRVR
ncbi:IclR family transcriptional regulator [Streptomyces sp. NPDC060223]|uniref:IclR family transcriptional regulator n=1 Tax=unclassified Streptomyces TaxID=2593676 RepID=UPI00363734E2